MRLTAGVARDLTEAVMPVARQAVAVAEGVARTLADSVGGAVSHLPELPTNLSGDTRSRGRARVRNGERKTPSAARGVRKTLVPPSCRTCGVPIARTGKREYCAACFRVNRQEHAERLKSAGPAALARFRESGDPTKREDAYRRIGEQTAARRRERAAWDRENPEANRDVEWFRREVLPGLGGVATSEIAASTGLSRNFAATVRSGKHVPHPMHWQTLGKIGRVPAS